MALTLTAFAAPRGGAQRPSGGRAGADAVTSPEPGRRATLAAPCTLDVNGVATETDAEGYLVHREQWSEDFARAQAAREGLALTGEHWGSSASCANTSMRTACRRRSA